MYILYYLKYHSFSWMCFKIWKQMKQKGFKHNTHFHLRKTEKLSVLRMNTESHSDLQHTFPRIKVHFQNTAELLRQTHNFSEISLPLF